MNEPRSNAPFIRQRVPSEMISAAPANGTSSRDSGASQRSSKPT
jgi:hypothetical protein